MSDTLKLIKDIKKKRSPELFIEKLFSKLDMSYNAMTHGRKHYSGDITFMVHSHGGSGAYLSVSNTYIITPLKEKFGITNEKCLEIIKELYGEKFGWCGWTLDIAIHTDSVDSNIYW